MISPTQHQIATYLTNYAISELVKYVIEDTGCSVEQAMERVYNSPLMSALQDEEGELYVQSPAYLYELMNGYYEKLRVGDDPVFDTKEQWNRLVKRNMLNWNPAHNIVKWPFKKKVEFIKCDLIKCAKVR